jgi:DNA-binding response OmpR family regulator
MFFKRSSMFSGLSADKAKILVVDDEPNIVQIIQDRLEMNHYEVLTACNGKEGLKTALQEKPDVILLDIAMPIMDGHEMLEELRKRPGGNLFSVIMLTVRNQPQDIAHAKSCGVDDYLDKPFDLGELLEKIKGVVKRREAVGT